jgi:hypothetical protein
MAYICGPEFLGMKPYTKDQSHPLFNKVPLPRMIVAQLDTLVYGLFRIHSRKLREALEQLKQKDFDNSQLAIYFSFFIILHEACWITDDLQRHASRYCGGEGGKVGFC